MVCTNTLHIVFGFALAVWASGCSLTHNLHDRFTFDLVDAGAMDASASDSGASDAGSLDTGPTDAGPTPGPTAALFPWNGYTTGSVWVPDGSPIIDHPRRPKLMWHPTEGATRYEVQMEADCPIAGFRDCTFPNPEVDEEATETTFRPSEFLPVSMVAPVGRRYVWRVRACNEAGCGGWSMPRYLDVGRLDDDYNGDGLSDLVVSAPLKDVVLRIIDGNVFVYYGRVEGFSVTPDLTLDNPTEDMVGFFGNSVASAGDLNGDGFSDLVIGAHGQSNPETNEGNAFVYYGSDGGLGETPSLTLDNPTDQPDGSFGYSVAKAGDINGDGFADLIVGAHEQDNPEENEGNAFVYYGGRSGLPLEPGVSLDNPTNRAGRYGGAIAGGGDLNGDGLVDLVVGAFFQANSFVYYGSLTGPSERPDLTISNPVEGENGYFGVSISCSSDIDADGYADLVVGARTQETPGNAGGSALVYFGRAEGLSPVTDIVLNNPTNEHNGWHGTSVTISNDVNGDGHADLIVGASQQDSPEINEGNVFVYYGNSDGVSDLPDLTLDNPLDQENGLFGSVVAGIGDTNGDGYSEIAIGAHLQDNPEMDEGTVYLYNGSASGISADPDVTFDNPRDREDDLFGFAVD